MQKTCRILEMKEAATVGCLTRVCLLGYLLKIFFIYTCVSRSIPPPRPHILWLFDAKSIEDMLELFLRVCLLDAPHGSGCHVCESQLAWVRREGCARASAGRRIRSTELRGVCHRGF